MKEAPCVAKGIRHPNNGHPPTAGQVLQARWLAPKNSHTDSARSPRVHTNQQHICASFKVAQLRSGKLSPRVRQGKTVCATKTQDWTASQPLRI